jgi:ribose transport system substrate-binding protein
MAAGGLVALSGQRALAGQRHIGFMIYDTSIPFFSNLIKRAQETAAANNVTLNIQSGNGDLSTQIAVVEQFIAQQVDLILICPGDRRGIVPAVLQANAADVPVIAVNEEVDTSTGAKIITYVGVNDYVFGQRQGDLLVQAVGEKAKVALILGKLGTAAQLNRQAGLMATLKQHPGITIVGRQAADWDNAKALSVTQDYLNRYPQGTLDAIIDQGPEGVTGANFAARSGRTDVKFIMGDYPADVRNAILQGVVFGTVDQDPGPQGKLAIIDAVNWLSGKQSQVPRPNHYLPLPIVTKANVTSIPAAWGG